jgi:DNA-binding response OmpR family regulator
MKRRILVIDDDAELVELLSFSLRRAGFGVAMAVDGIDGLQKARSLRPDLVLLDLMLPQVDGFAVCEILRRDPTTRSTPIIIVSAMSSQLSRLTGLECGANEYITKPFSLGSLVARIETVVPNV